MDSDFHQYWRYEMNNIFIVSHSNLIERWWGGVGILKRISGSNEQETIRDHKIEQKLFTQAKYLPIKIVYLVASLLVPTASFANHNGSRLFYDRGIAVTGINDLCGSPVFSLPAPEGIPPTIHVALLGEYNPEGDFPIPLTPTNCNDDIVVSTYTDPVFLAQTGRPDIDTRLKNIPLREVPVISNPDGSRSVLPSLDSVPGNALPPTKSNANGTITLGNWLNADGVMYLRCKADGTAKVRLRFRNLIPNGVYSVWGIWNATPPGAPRARLVPVPLGGIPNVVIPDHRGRATFFRELASCPKDATEDGSMMLFIDLAYHSDSNLSGAFPQIGPVPTKFKMADGTEFSSVLAPGAVTHDHVLFLISGEKL
jgi:hypothetical protein